MTIGTVVFEIIIRDYIQRNERTNERTNEQQFFAAGAQCDRDFPFRRFLFCRFPLPRGMYRVRVMG